MHVLRYCNASFALGALTIPALMDGKLEPLIEDAYCRRKRKAVVKYGIGITWSTKLLNIDRGSAY